MLLEVQWIKVKKSLTNDFRIIGNWFHENMMILNAKQYHYMYFGNVVKMMTLYSTE